MKNVAEILKDRMAFSFEVFPPKTDAGMEKLCAEGGVLDHLYELNPDYISCTYGAGGTNVGKNLEVLDKIKKDGKAIPVTHFTCVANTKEGIKEQLQTYLDHGIDLSREKIAVSICAQHNNGGLAVDCWWQTNIRGIFAVGEAAATHGIYRPGGSALNSGQVGSTRAAQYIAAHKEEKRSWSQEEMERLLRLADERICLGQWAAQKNSGYWKEQEKKAAMQMSQAAAMLRDPEAIEKMLEEICAEREQWQDRKAAQTVTVPAGWTEEAAWYRYYDQRLCQQMYLSAMKEYRLSGGKSRGSAIYQDENGAVTIPDLVRFSLDGEDGLAHQEQIQEIWLCPSGTCEAKMRLRHPLGEIPAPGAFETEWSAYRNKSIYEG